MLESAQPAIFKLLENKYFIDEIYEATVIRFNAFAAWLCDFADKWIFGGAVLLVKYFTIGSSWLYRLTDENVVNGGFDAGCGSIRGSGGILSRLHSGRVQTYLRIIGVALRAQSYRKYKNAQKVTDYRVDSVITRVMIRR